MEANGNSFSKPAKFHPFFQEFLRKGCQLWTQISQLLIGQIENFGVYQIENFQIFSKHTLPLFLAISKVELYPKCKERAFFLGHPVCSNELFYVQHLKVLASLNLIIFTSETSLAIDNFKKSN